MASTGFGGQAKTGAVPMGSSGCQAQGLLAAESGMAMSFYLLGLRRHAARHTACGQSPNPSPHHGQRLDKHPAPAPSEAAMLADLGPAHRFTAWRSPG